MELKEHLEVLAKREKSKIGNVLAAYEVKDWPDGRLDKLIEMGMLISISNATTIKCPGCSKGCPVEPVKGTANDGTVYYEVMCEIEGSIDIEPFYLKRWQITEKIRKYAKKKKTANEKKFQHWANPGDACFIIDENRIKFYFSGEIKDLSLKSESNTHRLLLILTAVNSIEPSKLKQSICSDNTNTAAKVVAYANKLINEKIAKLNYASIPSNVEFIGRDKFGWYKPQLLIYHKTDFEDMIYRHKQVQEQEEV